MDEINFFGAKTDRSKGGHMARHEPRIQSIKGKQKISFGKGSPIFLNFERRERGREKKKKNQNLLSSIYGVPSVGIRWAKNENSSTQRGLRVGTENTGFRRGFK